MQIKTEFVENRSVRILGIEFYTLHWIVILQLFRIHNSISYFFAFALSFKTNVRANAKNPNERFTMMPDTSKLAKFESFRVMFLQIYLNNYANTYFCKKDPNQKLLSKAFNAPVISSYEILSAYL